MFGVRSSRRGRPARVDARFARRGVVACVAVGAACGLAACGSSTNPLSSSSISAKGSSSAAKGSVVVGSANFAEDEELGYIYAQALRDKGVQVSTDFGIGTREVYYPEIKKGAVSIIPEYNGELLESEVDPNNRAGSTAAVDKALTAKLPSSLEILTPSSAQDKDSVTVTAATAKKDHLTSIADLKPYAKNMVFGGPSEFKIRSNGLPGLKKDYGLTFKSFQPTDESGPVTFADLTAGRVQAADVFTTSPQIQTDHLVVLSDPKNDFAAENVLPLLYKKDATHTIVSTLNAISAKLTTAGLRQLDNEVSVKHENYSTAATQWLKKEGLG